jgi:hypothetical protein
MPFRINNLVVLDDNRNLTNVGNASLTGSLRVNDRIVVDNNGNLTNVGNASFTGTGAIKIPTGSTIQQPASPVVGMLRYNTDTNKIEVYNGTSFVAAGGSSGGSALAFYLATA